MPRLRNQAGICANGLLRDLRPRNRAPTPQKERAQRRQCWKTQGGRWRRRGSASARVQGGSHADGVGEGDRGVREDT